MKIETIEQVERLIHLAITHKLDLLEIDNIKIVKTKHEFLQPSPPKSQQDEDDLLHWSSTWVDSSSYSLKDPYAR